MTAAELARALGGRRAGAQWMAPCPAHEDSTPSLAIREADGRVLVHCHAGCGQTDVIAALRDRGLWPTSERLGYPAEWGELIASYDYTDEHGEVLYQVCRFSPKSFRPRRPNGTGGWKWGYGNVRRGVLYRLPEVLENPIIFLVEGEKDAETLREWGFTATTNAGGASAPWLPEYTAALAGREVIILPDNDAPGWARAVRVARELLPVAAKVTVIGLEGAKDVSEWFERGHSECELIAMVEGCHAV